MEREGLSERVCRTGHVNGSIYTGEDEGVQTWVGAREFHRGRHDRSEGRARRFQCRSDGHRPSQT